MGPTHDPPPYRRSLSSHFKNSTDIVQIASGHAFNLVLTKEGKVFTWGRNEQGQVGGWVVGWFVGLSTPAGSLRPAFSCVFTLTHLLHHTQLGLGGGISMDVYSMEALPLIIEALQGKRGD